MRLARSFATTLLTTMVPDLNAFTAPGSKRSSKTNTADDLSTSTPKAGANAAAKDNKMAKITVRFTFKPTTKEASSKVAAVHTHLLATMQKAFDTCSIKENLRWTHVGPNWIKSKSLLTSC